MCYVVALGKVGEEDAQADPAGRSTQNKQCTSGEFFRASDARVLFGSDRVSEFFDGGVKQFGGKEYSRK
jgi:hypothetical protein